MFHDLSWNGSRSDDQYQRFQEWCHQLQKKSARLVVIEFGAGTAIPTTRDTSETVAERLNGKLIRINLRESEVPAGHFGLAVSALAGIRELDGALKQLFD